MGSEERERLYRHAKGVGDKPLELHELLEADMVHAYPGDRAWSIVARKTVRAFIDAETATYLTDGGTLRKKTNKQREIERAVFVALARLVADWPWQPYGMNDTAVLLRLREAQAKHEGRLGAND